MPPVAITSGPDRHLATAPDVNRFPPDIVKRARIYTLVPVSLFLVLFLLAATLLTLRWKRRAGRVEQAKKDPEARQDSSGVFFQSLSEEFQLVTANVNAGDGASPMTYPQYRESTNGALTPILPARLRQTSQLSTPTSPDLSVAVSSYIYPGSPASLVSATTMPSSPLLPQGAFLRPLSIGSTYSSRSSRSSVEPSRCSWAPGSPSLPQEILESLAQAPSQDLLASPLPEIMDTPEASPEIQETEGAAPVDPALTSPWETDPARYLPFVTSSVSPISRENTPSLDGDVSDSSCSEEAEPVESNLARTLRELSPAYGQLDFAFTFPPRPISASPKPRPVSSGSSVCWRSNIGLDSETESMVEYVIARVPRRFRPEFEAC
ncbi:hypothetical protein BD779DRAFT_1472486 [Infundibulicybe gibba]|nr:hypothetical protein BD779DRAFT_1472486 [Infundibulicybe gibba]